MQPQIQRGDHAERALGADEQRRQVVSGVVAPNLAVPVHHRPVRQRHIEADDLLAHVAVPNRAQSASVRRRHAADRRRITRGQVDAEHQPRGGRGTLNIGECRTCADVDATLDDVNLAEVAQPLRRQQHVVVFGHGPRDQRCPAALHGDVHARIAAGAQHRRDLVSRPRPHQQASVPAIAPGVVDTAAVEHIGIGDDVRGAYDPGQRVGQAHLVGVSQGLDVGFAAPGFAGFRLRRACSASGGQRQERAQLDEAVRRGRQVLRQCLRADDDAQVLGAADRDVEAVPVEQERDATRNVID